MVFKSKILISHLLDATIFRRKLFFLNENCLYCTLGYTYSGAIVPCNRHLQEERFFCPTLIESTDNCLALALVILYKRYLESKPISLNWLSISLSHYSTIFFFNTIEFTIFMDVFSFFIKCVMNILNKYLL